MPRAILVRALGGPEVLEYTEIEPPSPGRGELLVEGTAASSTPAAFQGAAVGPGVSWAHVARRWAAGVMATVPPAGKAKRAGEAGAHGGIVRPAVASGAETRRLTGGAGVPVVFDGVGK